MPCSYAAEIEQRGRQETRCQLKAETCPKHCWNSFTDRDGPGISTANELNWQVVFSEMAQTAEVIR